MADPHYHTCQTCQQPFECIFELGTCNYKCGTCNVEMGEPPYCQAEGNGYICTRSKGHGGTEHIAHRSKTPGDIYHSWPITKQCELKEECVQPAAEEVEATKECPNCSEDITDDNPAREWDGEDRCKSCYPICSSCEEELDEDNHFRCNKCSGHLCEDCARFCQCCKVYLCESHAENHGV